MWILSWVVFPAQSPDYNSGPLGAGVTRFVLLTLGLIWLFVLPMIIVRQEEGDLRWATIKRRLRLNPLRDPWLYAFLGLRECPLLRFFMSNMSILIATLLQPPHILEKEPPPDVVGGF